MAPAPTPRSAIWLTPLRLLGLGVLAVLHVVFRDPYYNAATGVYAGLLAVVTGLVWLRYAQLLPNRLPILECAVFYHYLHFGLSTSVAPLELGIGYITPTPENHEFAALIAILCALAMIAGHAIVVARLGERVPLRVLPTLTDDELLAASRLFVPIACLAIGIGIASPAFQRALAVSIGTFLSLFMGHVPLSVVSFLSFITRPSTATLLRFVIAICVLIVGAAVSSMLSPVILSLGTIAVLWWLLKRKLPFVLLAAALAFVLVLQPVKGYYRYVRGTSDNIGVVEAWTEAFALATDLDAPSGSTATRSRLSELSVLAYAIELVPQTIPHTNGQAYGMIPLTFVPRLIWPDKPNITKQGTDTFTIILGIQTEDWADHSAMALSVPPHGWLEHGLLGATLWTFVVGLIHGLATTVFRPRRDDKAGLLASALVLGPLVFGFDSGFVAFVAGSFQWFALATIFVWMIHLSGRWLDRRDSAAATRRWPSAP